MTGPLRRALIALTLAGACSASTAVPDAGDVVDARSAGWDGERPVVDAIVPEPAPDAALDDALAPPDPPEVADAEARDAGARDAGARDAEARDADARDAEAHDADADDAGPLRACPSLASEVTPSRSHPNREAWDFLVQDVCVVDGEVTAIDPRVCPGEARDLSLHEALPYRRVTGHVAGAPGGMLEISDSFPVLGPAGDLRVMHTFNAATPSWAGNERSFLDFDGPSASALYALGPTPAMPHSDGGEVVELDGVNASFVGTRDAAGVAPFFRAGSCMHDDSWLLFPTDVDRLDAAGVYLAADFFSLRVPFEPRTVTSFACTPPPSHIAGTYVNRGAWTFNEGIQLEAIISSHYDSASPEASTQMERFFYTRPYGRTRWEAWTRATGAEAGDETCTGPAAELHPSGVRFVRRYCREFTQIVPDPVGGFEPRSWVAQAFMSRGNLLLDGSFAMPERSVWVGEEPGAIVREEHAPTDLRHFNRYLVVRGGHSVRQSTPLSAPGAQLAFGARAWSEASARGRIVLLESPSGVSHPLDLELDACRRRYESTLLLRDDTEEVTFTIEADETYSVDDAWLTLS